MEYDGKWYKLDDNTYRMRVPGGWIVRSHVTLIQGGASIAMIFVADPDNEWVLT